MLRFPLETSIGPPIVQIHKGTIRHVNRLDDIVRHESDTIPPWKGTGFRKLKKLDGLVELSSLVVFVHL